LPPFAIAAVLNIFQSWLFFQPLYVQQRLGVQLVQPAALLQQQLEHLYLLIPSFVAYILHTARPIISAG